MSVEILSIDLNDATIAKLADAIVARMGGSQAVTQSNYPSPEYREPQSAPVQQNGPDPWQQPGVGVTQVASLAQSQAAPVQQVQAQGPPSCLHGAMRYVAAGFSKNNGKAYAAFYGCPAPRGPGQCKSVPAGQ